MHRVLDSSVVFITLVFLFVVIGLIVFDTGMGVLGYDTKYIAEGFALMGTMYTVLLGAQAGGAFISYRRDTVAMQSGVLTQENYRPTTQQTGVMGPPLV